MSHRSRAQGGLLRSIVTLMTGTLLAQIVSVGVTPILTRLFEPSDFGVLGLVNAAATVVAGVGALRYDMAVVLPKRDGEAANLVWLSLAVVAGITALSFGAVALLGERIAAWLGSPSLGVWLWAAPVVLLITASYTVLTNWTTRHRRFRRLSISAVIAAGSSAGAKLAGGAAALGVVGLVLGQLLGQLVALVVLAVQIVRDDARVLRRTASRAVALRMARRYAEFPKFHAPMSLANSLAQNMPLYLVGLFFSDREVGYWSLTVLVLGTPVTLIGNSARQVLFQRMSALLHEKKPLAPLLAKSTALLLLVMVVPTIAGWFLAPWAFSVVLGPAWEEAGRYARHLMLWQFSILVVAPTSAAFPVLRIQRLVLPWQLAAIAAGAAALVWGGRTGDPQAATFSFGAVMAAMNAIFTAIVLWAAVRQGREQRKQTDTAERR